MPYMCRVAFVRGFRPRRGQATAAQVQTHTHWGALTLYAYRDVERQTSQHLGAALVTSRMLQTRILASMIAVVSSTTEKERLLGAFMILR